MAKRLTNKQRLAFKIETLDESQLSEVLDYIATLENLRRATVAVSGDDELVDFLADAPDNRQARQIIEWERVRRSAESLEHPIAIAFAGKN